MEVGFDISGKAFGNLRECWHSWGRRLIASSDVMEFGKLEGILVDGRGILIASRGSILVIGRRGFSVIRFCINRV